MSYSRALVPFIAIFLISRPSSITMMESSEAATADAVAEDATPSSQHTDPTDDVNGHKLLHLCKHPDYRTYIRCLNRQKRHHLRNEHGVGENGEVKRCFDDCDIKECQSTKCFDECNKHCMKKTKETHWIATEWENECDTDDCKGKSGRSDLPTTNVTTNIELNNVINNNMPSRPKEPEGPNPPPRVPNTQPPPRNSWPCSWGYQGGCFGGVSIVPQVSFVPQITFGLGFGGGGISPNFQPGGFDCSYCGNPFLRHRCEVTCYHGQGSGRPIANMGGGTGAVDVDCVSPHCVGGG